MPRTEAVTIRVDDWADENFVARVLEAEASLLAALRAQAPEVHEARCDRIACRVMTRVAELPLPTVDCPAK
jgi:hypothetical protein